MFCYKNVLCLHPYNANLLDSSFVSEVLLYASWWISRYALLGAASFLGGSMRMTVSLCVIMVEITNNLKLLPLIMLVLLISKVYLSICFAYLLMDALWILRLLSLQAVGDAFNEGFYEQQARLRGIPLLESRPKYQMRNMKAKEACGNQKVISMKRLIFLSIFQRVAASETRVITQYKHVLILTVLTL